MLGWLVVLYKGYDFILGFDEFCMYVLVDLGWGFWNWLVNIFMDFVFLFVLSFFRSDFSVCEILGLIEVRVFVCNFILYICLMSLRRFGWRSFSYVNMIIFFKDG